MGRCGSKVLHFENFRLTFKCNGRGHEWTCVTQKRILPAPNFSQTLNCRIVCRILIKIERNGLRLPFLNEILRYFAAVAWSYLDFPAAEFFDFAADS